VHLDPREAARLRRELRRLAREHGMARTGLRVEDLGG
jgi:hypothetical protein